jgi:hypothetical protein
MDLIYVNRKRIDDNRSAIVFDPYDECDAARRLLTPLRVLRYSSLFGIEHDLAFDRATAYALGTFDRRRLEHGGKPAAGSAADRRGTAASRLGDCGADPPPIVERSRRQFALKRSR